MNANQKCMKTNETELNSSKVYEIQLAMIKKNNKICS